MREPLLFELLRREEPNPRQREFFTAGARHVAYGGARGGGKSWAARRKLTMLCLRYPGLRCLLLRRTMPELRENHIRPLQRELNGFAVYNASEKTFTFPNGSRLVCGYCDCENDCLQYQGQEYDVILFEEATQFEEEWVRFIRTSLRTVRRDFRPRCYYTMNPGGASHAYFKRLFIDRRFLAGEEPADYVFIPARVYDNRVLMDANPEYVRELMALDPVRRRMHLDGDWDVYAGQVFEEFRTAPDAEAELLTGESAASLRASRRWTHVIAPFDPPAGWKRYISFDFGYARPWSCGFWAQDGDGILYRVLELYGCVPDEPDTGLRQDPDTVFSQIRELLDGHPWFRGLPVTGVADPACRDASRGSSLIDMAARHGLYFEPGDNRRLPGWMQLHARLRFDENGIPGLYVFDTCRDFIRTLPLLRYDRLRPEDVDTAGEDHIADETRYLCRLEPLPDTRGRTFQAACRSPLEPDPAPSRRNFYLRG